MHYGGKMNQITGARVLVTGGAGFVGSAIVGQLLAKGAKEILVIDNFVRGNQENLAFAAGRGEIKVIEGDIRDVTLINKCCEGIDYVFHQAALRITRCAEAPKECNEVLIDGTLNILEAAVREGVKKIVFASSASVYGEPSYLPIDEAHPFNNRTMYGAGKIAAEQMLRAYFTAHGLPYVALRYFNVYGPRMDMAGVYTEVLVRWLDAIDENRPPQIFGNGRQSMDFVFVGDAARANLLAIESDVVDDVFNVGTGVQTSLKELCEVVLRLHHSSLVPQYREVRKVANVQARRAAVDKAEKMLGFKARVSLKEGLQELINWRCAAKSAALVGKVS
jgi:UDP-glucose 4-epimerase